VVKPKDVGPLISMKEMTAASTARCVRFGQEIGGVMELGMSNRGEHAEIRPSSAVRSTRSCRAT
jgi:NADH-quinone oxidoreductase subunit G